MSIVRPRFGDTCALFLPKSGETGVAPATVASARGGGVPVPDTRYVCLDCLAVVGAVDSPESVDFCDTCFENATVAHCGMVDTDNAAVGGAGAGEGGAGEGDGGAGGARARSHLNWLRIDGATGVHSVVRRSAADGAVYKAVTIDDLVLLPAATPAAAAAEPADADAGDGVGERQHDVGGGEEEEEEEDLTCTRCYVYDISPGNPAGVCPPGCHKPEHACCAEGTLQFLKTRGKLHYIPAEDGALPPPSYFCSKCCEEDQEKKLREGVVAELEDAGSLFIAPVRLHVRARGHR